MKFSRIQINTERRKQKLMNHKIRELRKRRDRKIKRRKNLSEEDKDMIVNEISLVIQNKVPKNKKRNKKEESRN